jgi:hypothetical protein
MFNYPVEKYILRFYKYKFSGVEKPVVIEAQNKFEARKQLMYYMQKFPQLQNLQVISESLSLPIFGTTTKFINEIEYVWVNNLTPNGWMELSEFQKLNYE